MAPKNRGYRVSKTTVIDLLNSQAGIAKDDLECAGEMTALLMCMSTYMMTPEDNIPTKQCASEQRILAQCEMKMDNRTTRKLRTDMKHSLVFNLLRLSNFSKKLK